MANRSYPTGKAQQIVADALGIKVNDFTDANEKFANLGLTVSAKREGRKSVPVVSFNDQYGGWTPEGEGESAVNPKVDLTKISQWMES